MSLQQKLNEMKEENKDLKVQAEKGAGLGEELEKFKKVEEESKAKTSWVGSVLNGMYLTMGKSLVRPNNVV